MTGYWASVILSPGIRCDNENCTTRWHGRVAKVWMQEHNDCPVPHVSMLCEDCRRLQLADEAQSGVEAVVKMRPRKSRQRRERRIVRARERAEA
jgi:hypothetical protein